MTILSFILGFFILLVLAGLGTLCYFIFFYKEDESDLSNRHVYVYIRPDHLKSIELDTPQNIQHVRVALEQAEDTVSVGQTVVGNHCKLTDMPAQVEERFLTPNNLKLEDVFIFQEELNLKSSLKYGRETRES